MCRVQIKNGGAEAFDYSVGSDHGYVHMHVCLLCTINVRACVRACVCVCVCVCVHHQAATVTVVIILE